VHIDSFAGDVGDFGEPLARTDWHDFAHPSTAIVETTADATGRSLHELDRLQSAVDCDALDAALTCGNETLALSFVYDGVVVNIAADGRLELWSP
jgi:hypothetical protein